LMNYSSGSESDISTDCVQADVQVVLNKLRTAIADLERRLCDESGKRLALTRLVDTTKSEVEHLKKSLDAEVKVGCALVQRSQELSFAESARFVVEDLTETEMPMAVPHTRLEEAQNLPNQEIDTCNSFVSHKVESDLNFSMRAFQEMINREKMDRERADEDILRNVSSQLKQERAARQKSDYAQLDELNAVFEEHIQNFLTGKSNDNLDQRKGNVVKADHSVQECVVVDKPGWGKPVNLCDPVLLILLAVSFFNLWTAKGLVSIS